MFDISTAILVLDSTSAFLCFEKLGRYCHCIDADNSIICKSRQKDTLYIGNLCRISDKSLINWLLSPNFAPFGWCSEWPGTIRPTAPRSHMWTQLAFGSPYSTGSLRGVCHVWLCVLKRMVNKRAFLSYFVNQWRFCYRIQTIGKTKIILLTLLFFSSICRHHVNCMCTEHIHNKVLPALHFAMSTTPLHWLPNGFSSLTWKKSKSGLSIYIYVYEHNCLFLFHK